MGADDDIWKPLVGFMLWLSALSGAIVTGLLLAGLPPPQWLAAVPALYGAGALATALRWRKLAAPSAGEWVAAIFFASLPPLYGLLNSFEG
jgi:hypothetical protein